jgi:hypothetical protein
MNCMHISLFNGFVRKYRVPLNLEEESHVPGLLPFFLLDCQNLPGREKGPGSYTLSNYSA